MKVETRINKLIEWSKQNSLPISAIPQEIEGKISPMYFYILILSSQKNKLTREQTELLENYGMVWVETKIDLNYLIKNVLIPWCKKNNKKISEIPETLNGKEFALYSLIKRIDSNLNDLDNESKELLKKFGYSAKKKIGKRVYECILTKLIPWCEENNKKIFEIPTNIAGKQNPLYTFLIYLRRKKDSLPDDIIALLDQYGMYWGKKNLKNTPVFLQRIKNELIPWCEKNKKTIKELPILISGKVNPLYSLVSYIRKIESTLSEETKELLNRYGMLWAEDTYKQDKSKLNRIKTRIENELIVWCKKEGKPVSQIPNDNKENEKLNILVRFIRKNKAILDEATLKLLDEYGFPWDSKRQTSPTKTRERIEEILISWCKANGKKISEIPTYINGKHSSLYNFVAYLRYNKEKLAPEIIKLLDEYGMNWGSKKNQSTATERINNELIPWCERTGKKIYDILPTNEDGTVNRLYTFVNYLKRRKDSLDDKTIELLNSYGFDAPKPQKDRKIDVNERVLSILNSNIVPYLQKNNCSIADIPKYIDEKPTAIYMFVEYVRKNKNKLSQQIIDLFDDYGMVWTGSADKSTTEVQARTIKKIYAELLPWCRDNNKKISEIPVKIENKYKRLYTFAKRVSELKDALPIEVVSALEQYGIKWKVEKIKDEPKQIKIAQRIENTLIPWCQRHNVLLSGINANSDMLGAQKIYSFVTYLRRNRDKLTDDSITLLNQYDMSWGGFVQDAPAKWATKLIVTELIPWCKENKKTIADVSSANDGRVTLPFTQLVEYLKRNKTLLHKSTIALLDNYGMVWELSDNKDISTKPKQSEATASNSEQPRLIESMLNSHTSSKDKHPTQTVTNVTLLQPKQMKANRTLDQQIIEDLIAWCNENNTQITDLDSSNNEGDLKLRNIIDLARAKKESLKPGTIKLLDKYGMVWDINQKIIQEHKEEETRQVKPTQEKTSQEKATNKRGLKQSTINRIEGELIPWCKKEGKRISDISSYVEGKKNPLYNFVVNLAKNKDRLTEEQIALLEDYGMVWRTEDEQKESSFNKNAYSRITNEIIPWCEENNATICEIPAKIDGKSNPLYHFVRTLRDRRHELSQQNLELLNKYGIQWVAKKERIDPNDGKRVAKLNSPTRGTINTETRYVSLADNMRTRNLKTRITETADRIFAWCDKNFAYICDIDESNSLYKDVQFVLKHKDYLEGDLETDWEEYLSPKVYNNIDDENP